MEGLSIMNMNVSKLCVYIALICVIFNVDYVTSRQRSRKSAAQSPLKRNAQSKDTVVNRAPKIKMMKRLTRNFEQGRNAKITVIFHASKPASIRWYKEEPDLNLDGSEVPGFMPLQGDPRYTFNYLRAGDVIAYSLNIRNFQESTMPLLFETIISLADGTMQYNFRTEILTRHTRELFEVNSPDWDSFPSIDAEYDVGQSWHMSCQAFIPYEMDKPDVNLLNELKMRKFPLDYGIDPVPEVKAIVIRNTDPWNESYIPEQLDNDPLLIEKIRRPVRRHATYEVRMSTSNSTVDMEGIYQCVLKRQPFTSYIDKSYVIGSMRTRIDPETYIPNMRMESIMIPCYSEQFNEGIKTLRIQRGKPTCLRCRGVGQPEVGLIVSNTSRPVKDMAGVFAAEYINVAEAGVKEVMYILQNPQNDLQGSFQCITRNQDNTRSASFAFRIELFNKW